MAFPAWARVQSALYASEVFLSSLGVEVGDVEQPVEREAPQAGHPFVQGIKGFQPETLEVPTPIPA